MSDLLPDRSVRTAAVVALGLLLYALPIAAQGGPQGAGGPTSEVSGVFLDMRDGQLKSHRVEVFVSANISVEQQPKLRLFRSHEVTTRQEGEEAPLTPVFVASGQERAEKVDGAAVRTRGTVLLFDLSGMNSGYKAMVRVRPALSWIDNGSERVALGSGDVNIGAITATMLWTLLLVSIALGVVLALARQRGGSPVQFLTGVDGHLSLAQTQIACWTVVVATVVLGYGLIRLEIPEIPEPVLVLMGASLATGGLAYFQDAKHERAAAVLGHSVTHAWAAGDLIRVFTAGASASELSLAKAQMLFWTLLLLVLFLSKSILEGNIWAVPWPLVALMGFSQAGYLAPKLTERS
jgi:hypothetical protein